MPTIHAANFVKLILSAFNFHTSMLTVVCVLLILTELQSYVNHTLAQEAIELFLKSCSPKMTLQCHLVV